MTLTEKMNQLKAKKLNKSQATYKGFANDDEMYAYLDTIRTEIMKQWDYLFDKMNTTNINLASVLHPLIDETYKCSQTGKKLRFVVIDDEHLLNSFSNSVFGRPDAILQLWDVKARKSLMMALNIRDDADVDWKEERHSLTKAQKILTSFLLNASEGMYPFYPVDNMVKTVASQKGWGKVFTILN